ncbi:hypothetical protein Pth03_16640 [Planotetraspora thailandica]|uniref:Acetoacetate decarboxylase n=1 Tax=Planotetraspora thailandica TaxID=487172 RepID=A0A8J3UZ28_9ACTN|nr:acetoacetate decarboxylase family protein [Planotetraspora thailandica]GII53275.1 hypothetical protein Pth03_16640 [Planotetraspora thailandica]
MASHLIQGRRVDIPVEIRDATACGATYLVRADAARAVLAYSGMDVTEVVPGKAACTLVFARYRESGLEAFHEFGVTFLVRPPDAGSPPPRSPLAGVRDIRGAGFGAFVHWLPVDREFALEAGRALWGFPRELADIDVRLDTPYKRCILRKDGRLVIDLLIRPGMPVPALGIPGGFGNRHNNRHSDTHSAADRGRRDDKLGGRRGDGIEMDVYSHRDGVTRRVPWTLRPRGVRTRLGGALIRLGNHPVAKELSELGLPKRALVTSSISRLTMSVGEASPEL